MRFKLPPLTGLRAFEAAGRHLNFRAAAEELGVTQGAVAQQVRGLEAHLGHKLFSRHAKGLNFTVAGRSLHGQVSAAFLRMEEAVSALNPGSSIVTISVTPTFAARWLIPNLDDLVNLHPDIDLRVLATESVLSFHSDGIDLAIRQGKSPSGASLETRVLFHQEVIAVASPKLVGEKPVPFSTTDFESATLLGDSHDLWSSFFEEVLASKRPDGIRTIGFSQTSLSIEAAIAGQGITLASRFLVSEALKAGSLVQIAKGSMAGESDFHLVAPRNPARRKEVQDVIDWLVSRSKSVTPAS